MVLDFDWECFFSPNFSPGFSNTQGWYRPWALAYLNLGGAYDTLPADYQYIPGKRYQDGLRAPVSYIEITKTLRFGSTCQIIMDICSDRDIFEINDNQNQVLIGHLGHMLPRMRFPYRMHRLNLQAKGDPTMPTNMFVGSLADVSIQSMSDEANAKQDGRWRVELNLVSPEHVRGLLGRNKGAPLWYHRANSTTDTYHLAFRSSDVLSFDSAITQIVTWMNQSRPTTDYPVTFSYTPKGTHPFDWTIGSNPIAIQGVTITFTNGSATVTGDGTAVFTSDLQIGQKIRLTADGVTNPAFWAIVASIESPTSLTLTANYSGTGGAGGAEKIAINNVITVDGRSTWNVLEQLLVYMGAVEGIGKKYIPQCSATGVIDVVQGGYDKDEVPVTSFRQVYSDNVAVIAGNVTFTHSSNVVSGDSNTRFKEQLFIGQQIRLDADNVWATIQTISDDWHLNLTTTYSGAGGTGAGSSKSTGMQKNTSTVMPFRFNGISVPFSIENDAEYWIKFTLYVSDGVGGWITVLTDPASGYKYVPFDAKNTTSRKFYKFPTQEITPQATYKWDVDLVTAGTFTISATGGSAYSPQNYQFLNSPLKLDYSKVNSFLVTRGLCYEYGQYGTAIGAGVSPEGCKDGGASLCIDSGAWSGCYPDPQTSASTSLTGILTFTKGSATVTGVNTLFTSQLVIGSKIRVEQGCVYVEVLSIQSDTSLTLTANFSDPCYAGNLSGAAVKLIGTNEVVDPTFGIQGAYSQLKTLSNAGVWDTVCRKNSKKLYQCQLNTDSIIRAPISGTIIFNDGYTGDLIGKYVEVYSPELDDVVVVRVTEQKHVMAQGRMPTILKVFRI